MKEVLIVGPAKDVNIEVVKNFKGEIYALNAAHDFLVENGIKPNALVTGDARYISSWGKERLKSLNYLVTFDYVISDDEVKSYGLKNKVQKFKSLGRVGFSLEPNQGFYHGCSSFFLCVQYLLSKGYRSITTIGIKFPPPEMYTRISNNLGHPEFVYITQLKNG